MRLIDADELIEKCGEWYTEEGPEEGFIGTLKQLLDKQPTIEPNLILPEQMERGDCYEVGESIVVMNHDDYYDLLCKSMENEPKQEWIPCSERLPEEEFGIYLICTEAGYMCSCRWTNDMYGLGATEWSEWGWHIMDKPPFSVVTAWMPLQPWKGTDDE